MCACGVLCTAILASVGMCMAMKVCVGLCRVVCSHALLPSITKV